MGCLYRLDFSNGKSYIGITSGTAQDRYKAHQKKSKNGKLLVNTAWREFGAPCLIVLAIIENRALNAAEIRAIEIFETLAPKGYNMAAGGAGILGCKHSSETRVKISNSKRGRVRRYFRVGKELVIKYK